MASQYGSFLNYYAKRYNGSSIRALDDRLSLIDEDWIVGKRVLDIGCNAGHVSIQLAQFFRPRSVVGLDIDAHLIRTARAQLQLAYSLIKPDQDADTMQDRNQCDSLERAQQEADYFPLGMPRMFGYVPYPVAKPDQSKADSFPLNCSFQQADYVKSDHWASIPESLDTILALSVLKWIHLNHGDDGLLALFRKIYTVLKPGGTFIVEIQDWASYAEAKKQSDELRESYKTIRIRPCEFTKVLKEDIGFESCRELGNSSSLSSRGTANRPVLAFFKSDGPLALTNKRPRAVAFEEDLGEIGLTAESSERIP